MFIFGSLNKIIPACICLSVLFMLSGCTKEKQSVPEVAPSVKSEFVAVSKVLATIADNEKQDAPPSHETAESAEKPAADMVIEINRNGNGVAYIAKVGERFSVVHNGKAGKLYDLIEAFTLILSPDGQRVAYGAKNGDTSYVVVDAAEKGPFADRGRIAFSPDSKHVGYDAKIGNKWYMYVDNIKNDGALQYFDRSVFSSDSSKVTYLEVADVSGVYRLITSDLKFKQNMILTIADTAYSVNAERTAVAAVEKKQTKWNVISFDYDHPDKIMTGESYDDIKQLTFSETGKSLAYIGVKDGKSYLVLDGKRELLPEGEYPWPFVIRPDNKSVGIFIVHSKGKMTSAFLHHAFAPAGKQNKTYKEGAQLTYSSDGTHHAYVAILNERFTIVVDGKEGPFFDRVVTPHFSPDGKFLVYRARQDNKRFVVIADLSGKIVKQLPSYERVFDTTFTPDGASVAYGVKDGKQIMWKVEKL
jgi:Tol biopolymer transport system component